MKEGGRWEKERTWIPGFLWELTLMMIENLIISQI